MRKASYIHGKPEIKVGLYYFHGEVNGLFTFSVGVLSCNLW